MSIKSEALNELALTRDEARLKLHLLTMGARDAWQDLESEIDSLEQKLSQGGEKATEAGLAAARRLGQSARDFFTGHDLAHSELSKPVGAIMSKRVRACSPDDSLNAAAFLLWETNCGAVPVVTVNQLLIGMISDRDICMASCIQGRRLEDLTVENAMSNVVHSCAQHESIARALEIMSQYQVRRVPIVHEDGHLVGIVSLANVARWAQSQQLGRAFVHDALVKTLAAISKPPTEAERSSSRAAE